MQGDVLKTRSFDSSTSHYVAAESVGVLTVIAGRAGDADCFRF